jgi:hypothetical protein
MISFFNRIDLLFIVQRRNSLFIISRWMFHQIGSITDVNQNTLNESMTTMEACVSVEGDIHGIRQLVRSISSFVTIVDQHWPTHNTLLQFQNTMIEEVNKDDRILIGKIQSTRQFQSIVIIVFFATSGNGNSVLYPSSRC